MTLNRRIIKKWWISLGIKPVSPGLERIGILFTIGLTLVSTFIALMTFNQQQEIKGMKSLLLKQDTIIEQNRQMILRLDSTQNYAIDQINAIKTQTKSNEYSSKPLLDFRGLLTLVFDARTKEWKIQFSVSNYGLRPASMVKVNGSLQKISGGFFSTGLEFESTTHTEKLLQNQEMIITVVNKGFIDNHLNDFESFFFVSNIKYFDPLTKTLESTKVYKRLVKIDSSEFEQRFSFNELSKKDLDLIGKLNN